MRVGAPPIHLIEGRTFVVGRSNDCDLTVPSQRVSRRHAEIGWANGKPILRDLGSQNGTQVNGKRIKGEHALADGDELEFGPYMCTYRIGGAAPAAPGLQPDSNALTQPMVGDAMAGRIDQINLSELLQTLEFNQKTGTLEIFGSDGEGFIVIQSGRPTFAQAEGKQGEEAVYELIRYKNGQFSFSADVSETGRNLDKPMGSLLMEAMRRLDEG